MSAPEQRHMGRQGAVRLRNGVPHPDRDTTLSLLPLAPINQWLYANRDLFRGRLLDVGAGNQPYAPIYDGRVDETVTLDFEVASHLSVCGLADALPFRDESFDTILCTEVLEHVGDAERAAAELYRVARPGGNVLVTVPYLYPTHEAPYDFRRFTHFGLRDLLERRGFEVLSVETKGRAGLLLAHYAVLAAVGLLGAVGKVLGRPLLENRAVRAAIWGPQELALRLRSIPRTLGGSATVASLGYMAVAKRPKQA